MVQCCLVRIFTVYAIAFSRFVISTDNRTESRNESYSEDDSYHFNQDLEMSESYPERAAIYALSNTKNQSTMIPKELKRVIYEFAHDPLWFLSKLQRNIMNCIEYNINAHLVNGEWLGLRVYYYTRFNGTRCITICAHFDLKNPNILRFGDVVNMEAIMTQSARDCMNQMLLRRHPSLTI